MRACTCAYNRPSIGVNVNVCMFVLFSALHLLPGPGSMSSTLDPRATLLCHLSSPPSPIICREPPVTMPSLRALCLPVKTAVTQLRMFSFVWWYRNTTRSRPMGLPTFANLNRTPGDLECAGFSCKPVGWIISGWCGDDVVADSTRGIYPLETRLKKTYRWDRKLRIS